jgi:hypothetical protein
MPKTIDSETKLGGKIKHGDCINGNRSTEYRSWESMRDRCNNPQSRYYKNYGGRGIKVCNRWLHNYKNFLSDMGRRPSHEYTLDRINNDGNYSPNNCRWTDWKTQNNNKRKIAMLIEFNGERKTFKEWANIYAMPEERLRLRIRRFKWTMEKAVSTPSRIKNYL